MQSLALIDSTLREGEQHAGVCFDRNQKIELARLLDAFGVEYLEVTSPCSSPASFSDCQALARLGLKAKILAHTRCHPDDVERAVDAGVDGINMVIGTSSFLRRYSHGKSIEAILEIAEQVISRLRGRNIEIRFSTEDSLRSDPEDLFRIYQAVDAMGVDRVGVADTVGIGTPRRIGDLVARLRYRLKTGIEFHGHNDTGCAIANAHAAWEAGATHIDTTVLGIGERNGITALSGFIARVHADAPQHTERYKLPLLKELDAMVANIIGTPIPFNNCLTSPNAFSHKAGIHTKAVLANPATYEILRPEDFGMERQIHIGHRLTGWNAVRHRAEELGLQLSDALIKQATRNIKTLADNGEGSMEEVDRLLIRAGSGAFDEEVFHVANPG